MYPIAPGHEIMGLVTEIGKSVKKFKIGDKVCVGAQRNCCGTCKQCLSGEVSYCPVLHRYEKWTYGRYWGGYSTHAQQPELFTFNVPDGLPENLCAPLLCAGITVWAPIVRFGKPGMRTAVSGIGGLGHLAVQYLAKLGYEVTAITTSMEKKDYIMSLGATNVLNINDEKDLKTFDSAFDLIISTASNSPDFTKLLGLCSQFCTIAQCGLPNAEDKFILANMSVFKGVTLVGSALGTLKETEEMLEFSAKHKIFPKCEEFDFMDLPKAFNHLEHGKPNFRCILNVKDYSEKNGYFK